MISLVKEKIISSAIYWTDTGYIYLGLRHIHCFKDINSKVGIRNIDERKERKLIQGFFTSYLRFVDRIEGAEIAINSGQIEKLDHPPYLYSEDLW